MPSPADPSGPVDPAAWVDPAAPVGPADRASLARELPDRARRAVDHGGHRELGRVVRDAVLLLLVEADDGAQAAALAALERLAALQGPSGTFRGGDNVDSPPDTAFTINDLAWARVALGRPATGGTAPVGPALVGPALVGPLDAILRAVTPALVTGGVHTPNHRWEIASALTRLWEAQGVQGLAADDPVRRAVRERALQWLAEGVDLQADGMFSERSANYAAHVSVPALLALGRILERPDLIDDADRATRVQAQLTGADGLVETLASRRQDQFALFDGGALHPLFRAHAARTGDPLTARAARRTADRADADARLTFAAMALEDPSALGPLPSPAADPTPGSPEVVELADSGLVRIDHGASSAVLHGGGDVDTLDRVVSGAATRPTLARLRGRTLGLQDLRLSRDFFNLGPLRPGAPRLLAAADPASTDPASADPASADPASTGRLVVAFEEEVGAGYYQPLAPADHDPEGRYALEFNGRFAAAMAFSRRDAAEVSLRTRVRVEVGPGELALRVDIEGPTTPLCLLLALDGGSFGSGNADGGRADTVLQSDDRGRRILALTPDEAPEETSSADIAGRTGLVGRASCVYANDEEALEITAAGAPGSRAFYHPGEAYTFLGATDEPGGDVLLIPVSSAEPLALRLRLSALSPH
ncbi:hypothetical protein ACXET9_07920 [Brachybacterium sp. DNPG3]